MKDGRDGRGAGARAGRALLAALALCGGSGCLSEMAELVDDARVTARIGVMAHTEVGWITETKVLEEALRFYRTCKVDAVVIAGGATKNGYRNQYEVLDTVWTRVFGGTDVRLVMTEGRHEVNGFHFAVSFARPLGTCDVLTFHGGEKRALTDELGYYPREANVIGAGSMHGVSVPAGFSDAKDLSRRLSDVAQGLLVSVYSGRVSVRRLDFGREAKRGAFRAEDVAVPWEVGEPLPREEAPQFWPDTRIAVACGRTTEGEAAYTVRWPNVLKRFTGARARHYEVEVADAAHPTMPFLRKSVLSNGFCFSEERDIGAVMCRIKVSELPPGMEGRSLVFRVTPVGMFGKHGKTFSVQSVGVGSDIQSR